MKDFFYRCLMFLAKRFGTWVFLPIAWPVATGYFLFFPRRVAVSVRFYRTLFPGRSRLYPLWCAWQQYHRFVHVFLDRFLLKEGEDLQTVHEGWEHLTTAAESGRGGIILMSHVGSWEIAAQLLGTVNIARKLKMQFVNLLNQTRFCKSFLPEMTCWMMKSENWRQF